MRSGKEAWIDAHEQLIGEYMDRHPEADESKVYDAMAEFAGDRARDNLADLADVAKDRAKEAP